MAAWATALLFLLGARAGHAGKRRVVVLGFSGPQAALAERAVADVVQKRHVAVPAASWTKAKKRLGASQSDDDVARVAAEVQADAIVSGWVTRNGTRFVLKLVVREGRSGSVLDTIQISLRSPRVDDRARADIADRLPAVIARAAPIANSGGDADGRSPRGAGRARAGPAEGEDDEPVPGVDVPLGTKKPKKAVAEDRGAADEPTDEPSDRSSRRRPKKGRRDDREAREDAAPDEEADRDTEERSNPRRSRRGRDRDEGDRIDERDRDEGRGSQIDEAATGPLADTRDSVADLGLGVSFIGRRMSFIYQGDLAPDHVPAGYRGNPVPGVLFQGEIFPFAMGHKGDALAGLGLRVVFDRVLTMKSKLRVPGKPQGVEVPASQTRYGAALRYRWNIGHDPTNPTVRFALGYEHLSFAVDNGNTPNDLPNVAYGGLAADAGIMIPFGSPKIGAFLDGQFLFILSAGDIQTTANYGGSQVTGVAGEAGLDIHPTPHFLIRLGGRFTYIAYAFDGSGAKTARDMDPDKDVGGAEDMYFGGYVLGGYSF